MNCDDQEICTHRAPGVCCPEPSCDHGWHGRLKKMMPHEKNKLVCEGCGKACNQCEWLIAEVERLRSLNESLMENGNDLRTRCQKAEARIKELQDLIDKPPEDADWVADYHLLQSALDGPIIDAARKWHAAYRKAQNSNLMRAKEVERLQSDQDAIMKAWDKDAVEKDARIKELQAEIERIDAAFLEAKRCPTCNGKGFIRDPYLSRVRGLIIDESIDRICPMCEGKGEEKAREALERIKAETGSGDHVAGANKLILTAEQREEEGKRDA